MCMSTAKTKHPKNQKQAALHMVESEIRGGECLRCELQGDLMLIPRLSGYAFIIHLCLKKVTLYSKYSFKTGFSGSVGHSFPCFCTDTFSPATLFKGPPFLYCHSLPNILNFHKWRLLPYKSKPIICRSLLLSIF